MDLTSNHPFWTIKNGIGAMFPPMEADVTCEVVIVGGGVTGALAAEELSRHGVSVCLLDKRDVGSGSTSASTAMLQYEIDTHLVDLSAMHGWELGRAAYRACYESIDAIETTISRLGHGDCGFTRRNSLYLASEEKDAAVLRDEARARINAGIHVSILSPEEIRDKFGFEAPLALLSEQAAEVDSYQLTCALLEKAAINGALIYDRTSVERIESETDGVRVYTNRDTEIAARWLIVASGYEAQEMFDTGDFVNLNSSFAIASAPVSDDQAWWQRCMIWESARPYFYLRSDNQGRIILGGEDEPFRCPEARDKLIGSKGKTLAQRFGEMFPDIPFETEYQWAGTFGETDDGLPYIGRLNEYPRCLFSLGYGGNGITYSQIAAQMHSATVRGEAHPLSAVMGFNRRSGK